jgi:hypothetical protein
MGTLVSAILIAILFLGCAILLRNVGAHPGRLRSAFAGILLAAALFTLAAVLVSPFVVTVPKSLTTIAERVLPHSPKSLQPPFHYRPTAEKSDAADNVH